MDNIIRYSNRILKNTPNDFVRYLYDEIEFDARLIIIKGCRGVGKTTLLNQFLLNTSSLDKCIHLSLDHIYFTENKLLYTVEALYNIGYTHFVIDKVHKYENWSVEIKNIYDMFSDIKVMVTASSALNITTGGEDLSRRADKYNLQGLSFREFLNFSLNKELPRLLLNDIIENHNDIAADIMADIDIKKHFTRYLKSGYYPFFKEAGRKYHDRIASIVNQVIEVDLPPIFNIDYSAVRQIKKLLSLISRISPFSPNISKLSGNLGMSRNSLLQYIDYLDQSDLINTLKSHKKSDSVLAKPDKIYLENTNIAHALALTDVSIGTAREIFVRNALSVYHTCSTPAAGDVMVDDSYIFEIGGPNKNYKQIFNIPNAYLVKDIYKNYNSDAIPMWMLGMLY